MLVAIVQPFGARWAAAPVVTVPKAPRASPANEVESDRRSGAHPGAC